MMCYSLKAINKLLRSSTLLLPKSTCMSKTLPDLIRIEDPLPFRLGVSDIVTDKHCRKFSENVKFDFLREVETCPQPPSTEDESEQQDSDLL